MSIDWISRYREGENVFWLAEIDGKTIKLGVAGEALADMAAQPMPLTDGLLKLFDDLTARVDSLVRRKVAAGQFETDGSIMVRSEDWRP